MIPDLIKLLFLTNHNARTFVSQSQRSYLDLFDCINRGAFSLFFFLVFRLEQVSSRQYSKHQSICFDDFLADSSLIKYHHHQLQDRKLSNGECWKLVRYSVCLIVSPFQPLMVIRCTLFSRQSSVK